MRLVPIEEALMAGLSSIDFAGFIWSKNATLAATPAAPLKTEDEALDSERAEAERFFGWVATGVALCPSSKSRYNFAKLGATSER